jgi:RNA polymerase sigma-70 factor, ECF subfamily
VDVGTGRADLYGQLFEEQGPRLWRLLVGVAGGRRDLAEDALAEAFARAIQRASGIRDPMAWIFRTAVRLVREELVRGDRALPEQPVSEQRDLDGLYDLMNAMRSLSPNQRAAVILHYAEDLPVREVAKLMGSSAPTVRVHLHRARSKLRSVLSGGPDD